MTTVTQLTQEQLVKAANDLVKFFDVTFFEERSVTIGLGLVFAMEMQAVQLGLFDSDGDELTQDSASLMDDFANAINECGKKASVPGWENLSKYLPYGSA